MQCTSPSSVGRACVRATPYIDRSPLARTNLRPNIPRTYNAPHTLQSDHAASTCSLLTVRLSPPYTAKPAARLSWPSPARPSTPTSPRPAPSPVHTAACRTGNPWGQTKPANQAAGGTRVTTAAARQPALPASPPPRPAAHARATRRCERPAPAMHHATPAHLGHGRSCRPSSGNTGRGRWSGGPRRWGA